MISPVGIVPVTPIGGESTPLTQTLAIADDHPVVRAGIRTLLESEPSLTVVAEFDDVPSIRHGLQSLQPAALLLDLTMAGASTLELIPQLLATTPQLRIIVLTMHDDPGLAREALRLGAYGYLLKEAAAEELLQAVRTVLAGRTYLQPTLGARLATSDQSTAVLTDRELEIVRLLAGGYTNSEIATRLYLSLRTVESHRSQIRSKLGVESRAELSSWAREHRIAP